MNSAANRLWRKWRRTGDAEAFAQLVRPELPYARDFARRLGASSDEAEDAVQESLALLARERSDAPREVGFRAWICRRVSMRVRMRIRSGSRRRKYERAAARPAATTDDATSSATERDEVDAALARVGPDDRAVLVLRYLHALDYRDVAAVLGLTESATRVRVHRALERMRRVVGSSSSALLAPISLASTAADAALAATIASAAPAAAAISPVLAATLAVAAAVAIVAGLIPLLTGAPESEPPETETEPVVIGRADEPTEVPPPPARRSPPAGGIARLRDHLTDRVPLDDELWDDQALDALVLRGEGAAIRPDPPTEEEIAARVKQGGVVELPAGRHRVERTIVVRGDVDRLDIRGAGRGVTILEAEILVVGSVEHLRVSDLTVEGDALDVRGAVSARFERVDFRGWTTTAGYSAPIGATGEALLSFRDCAFIGGYRRPAGGHAIAIRGAVAALFSDCRFTDLESIFGGCADAHPRTLLYRDGCIAARAATHDHTSRDIHTSVRRAREDDADPRLRIRDIRTVAEAYESELGARLVGVQALVWDGLEEPYFVLHVAGTHPRSILTRSGRALDAEGFILPRDRAPPGAPGVLALWPDLPGELPADGVVLWTMNGPDGPVPGAYVIEGAQATFADHLRRR